MHPSPAWKPTTTHSSIAAIPSAQEAGSVRLAAGLVLALLRAYKVLISPLFTGCCRFEPSCADYMAEAVRRHGALKGVGRGLRRLARCHPFGGHGFDPV